MHTFYLPSLTPAHPLHTTLLLDKAQSHHAIRVLRLKAGQQLEIFNGQGTMARATLEMACSKSASLTLTALSHSPPSHIQITLATAIPKGPRADEMVNQLSQLGVGRLIPLLCDRAVVRPSAKKLQRFQAACIESAKQARRPYLMSIGEAQSFEQVLTMQARTKLMAHPYDAAPLRMDPLGEGETHEVLVLIGPEGGFTELEVERAKDGGFCPWQFAPHILRIETAAVAAGAILCSHLLTSQEQSFDSPAI